jgi:hypothetical protein
MLAASWRRKTATRELQRRASSELAVTGLA